MKTALKSSSILRSALCSSVAISSLAASQLILATTTQAQDAIEVIVVTARKREESLEEVPVSISAVNAEKLERAGVTSLTEFFSLVPGVENNEDGSRIASKPAIRGVGSQENSSIRAKVTSFIDGMPILGTQGISSFAGLSQVEVLRGPQSAAFGRSTFGGAINYVTRDPGDELEINLRAGFGTQNTRDLSAVVSAPLSDYLGVILTGEEKNYGGPDKWVTTSGDQLGKRNDWLASAKLAFGADEKFQGEIFYMHQDVNDGHDPVLLASTTQLVPHPDDPDGMCAINGGGNSCVILGAVDTSLVPLVFDYDFDNPTNPILKPGARIKRDRVHGRLSSEFADGYSVTLLGSYTDEEGESWFDRDTLTLPAMSTIHAASSPEISEAYGEARVASPAADRLNWLIGASIYDYDFTNTVFNNKIANIVMDFFAEGATNVGIFFNLGYNVSDRLTASFEGRYQIDKIRGEFPANPSRNAPAAIALKETTKSFQPRVSLTYAVNDANNFYVQVARGTNPAGFNVNAQDPILNQTAASENFDLSAFLTFDEETIWSYETGLKGRLADSALRYAAAVYYLDWKGYVQPATVNWTPASGMLLPGTAPTDYFSRLFVDSGDLDGFGVELEAVWDATEQLQFDGAFAYSGVKFNKNSCSIIPTDYGVPPIRTSPFQCASLDGAVPPMFSRYTTSISATYTVPLSSALDGYGRIYHAYRSKRYTEVINTDFIKGYHTVNLNVGVRSERWFAELYVKNLFDDDTPAGAVRFFDGRLPGMVFNTTYQLRRPRQIGVSLGYDF